MVFYFGRVEWKWKFLLFLLRISLSSLQRNGAPTKCWYCYHFCSKRKSSLGKYSKLPFQWTVPDSGLSCHGSLKQQLIQSKPQFSEAGIKPTVASDPFCAHNQSHATDYVAPTAPLPQSQGSGQFWGTGSEVVLRIVTLALYYLTYINTTDEKEWTSLKACLRGTFKTTGKNPDDYLHNLESPFC